MEPKRGSPDVQRMSLNRSLTEASSEMTRLFSFLETNIYFKIQLVSLIIPSSFFLLSND
ncbi:hypothetical protein [Vibrio gallaecicus]|uniref:hypothetical protein n=1 Tax=Vibrio gallaecicus TaxID=552386 RepID=UPI0025B5EA4C|nr:hypothetical protein [Vibrio gallaecicus]MDN3615673.1 hypothetical protein [Vibrio gallaecicus]